MSIVYFMTHLATDKHKQPFTWLYSLWKFSRPHTIIGTSLSVIALYLIAIATTDNNINNSSLIQLLGTWIACLAGNIYIVGLNQLEDISIDKINKPHLPIASGEYSPLTAKVIIAFTGILALSLSAYLGYELLATVAISLTIGTAYSKPPIRLKRFPLLAALCIFTVRGVIVNLGIFLHFSRQITGQSFLPTTVWVLTLFILVFTVAIAIFKDVPDLEGDKKFNITTYTLILGKPAVFNLARGIITGCYLGMMLVSVVWLTGVNTNFMIVSHVILLGILWWRSQQADLEEKSSIASFYQFIWKLFFLEYLLFPLACFL